MATHWRNDGSRYGAVARALHWATALLVFGLFGLGLYMRHAITYYDPLYNTLPAIHKALGVTLLLLFAGRFAWRLLNPPPPALASHTPAERRAARAVHAVLYLLPPFMGVSGYLITTAHGRPFIVFGVELLPSLVTGPGLEETAGAFHLGAAIVLVALAALHALAALKHHFIDRDRTLLRML
jgi:cytochrome b561